MRLFIKSVQRFLTSDSGATSVEYSFMLGFIVVVCVSTIAAIGQATHNYYLKSLAKLP